MKTAKQKASLWAEYHNLSKRGMLSSYDWFVVTINVIVNGREVVVSSSDFANRKEAWLHFTSVRDALAPKKVVA